MCARLEKNADKSKKWLSTGANPSLVSELGGAVHDTDRAGSPRNGIYDEEEKVQVYGGSAPGGAGRGAFPERGPVREDPSAGRRQLPGAQQ